MSTPAEPGLPPTPRQRATELVGETMSELVEFWGFKGSLGRIWATLYLSVEPLTAEGIAGLTGLSGGAVSMGLHELDQWGLLDRVVVHGDRKRHFTAHTDVVGVIRRIFRERELRLVARAVARFEEALRLLEQDERRSDADMVTTIERLRGLLSLARTGYTLLERFADVGDFTLRPIQGTLSRFRRDAEDQ